MLWLLTFYGSTCLLGSWSQKTFTWWIDAFHTNLYSFRNVLYLKINSLLSIILMEYRLSLMGRHTLWRTHIHILTAFLLNTPEIKLSRISNYEGSFKLPCKIEGDGRNTQRSFHNLRSPWQPTYSTNITKNHSYRQYNLKYILFYQTLYHQNIREVLGCPSLCPNCGQFFLFVSHLTIWCILYLNI